MTFTSILAALGLAPKTLPQATATLETAKATFDSVNALFANAGLNLDAMLAAGPDALKSHLESLSAKDAELAAAQAKVTELESQVATVTTNLNSQTLKFSAIGSALAPLGITATTSPDAYPELIAAHVKTAAALELAKGGHGPIADAPTDSPANSAATRREKYAHMATLPESERAAYFEQHLRGK